MAVAGDTYAATVAPTPAGVTACAWTAATASTFGLVRGCAALTVVTAASSTAKPAAGASGDYPNQVKAVISTLYDPDTAAVTSKVVARYAYDAAGLLVAVWDPRDTLTAGVLSTRYTYTSAAGRTMLASVTPASAVTGGLTPTSYTYDSTGRLATAAQTGAGTTTLGYDVALSGTNLPTMTAAATATWDQTAGPTSAVEVFPPGASTSDPRQGTITYMDAVGRTVNTADYGAGAWNVTAQAYTPTGQTDWTLSAGNRARALASAGLPDDPATLPVGNTITRARLLRTQNTFSTSDPTLLIDTLGPLTDVVLASGTAVSARAHTVTVYDEAAPASVTDASNVSRSGPWRLPTTITSSAAVRNADGSTTDKDPQVTKNTYDNSAGSPANAGWLFATATKTTVKDVTSGKDLSTVTGIDGLGRVVQSRQPKSSGSDAGTTVAVYYSGDAAAAGTACDNKPEWAGLACSSGPAGQPSGVTIPTTSTTYTRDLNSAVVSEVSGSTTRTTTTSYDLGGRVTKVKVAVTGAPAGDAAVPDTTTAYWPESGLTKTVTSGSATATSTYDALGRVVSQTDGSGNTATTSYDTNSGRVSATNDGKAGTTYTYNGTDAAGKVEYRGLLTGKTVAGLVGATTGFKAAYNPDGTLVLEQHPNGMKTGTTVDPAGRETDQTWTAADGTLLAQNSRTYGSDGNVAIDTGLGRSSSYRYDGADRLTQASTVLTGLGTCATRRYTLDDDSNRTNLETWTSTTPTCPDTSTAATSTAARTYDTADRATQTGYTYDTLGRTRALPAADSPTNTVETFTYYGNDLVATATVGTTSRAYQLDALGRIAAWTDTTAGTVGATVRNHYVDTSDNPAWTDNGDNTWTRPVTSISGDLALTITGTSSGGPTTTIAQLGDLHGDIIATVANTTGANT